MKQRKIELDIIRGLLLLSMIINHTPGKHLVYTSQPFGFISGAEGFILLSAFLAGLNLAKRTETSPGQALGSKLIRRSGQIYLTHILMIGFVFLVMGNLLSGLIPYYNIANTYIEKPIEATLSALVLLYQPPLLDILPMYVFFLLLTPIVWRIRMRCRWRWIFIVSVGVWLMAQCGLKPAVLGEINRLIVANLGAFNIFAWQLLWILGLWWGEKNWELREQGFRIPWPLTIISLILCIFFFFWRFPHLPLKIELGDYWFLLDKWNLAPLRLLNLLVLLVVCRRGSVIIMNLIRRLRVCALLGQNSLLVFFLHGCLGLLASGWIELHHPGQGVLVNIILIQILFIFLVTWLANKKTSASSCIPLRIGRKVGGLSIHWIRLANAGS